MASYGILAVDCEVCNLNALERTFRRGYHFFSATNSEDALAILEQNDIALIISDHRTPGMDGVEFLKRASQKHPDTIRMILTAYIEERLLLNAMDMGYIYKCIAKPWKPEEVKAIVETALKPGSNAEIYEKNTGLVKRQVPLFMQWFEFAATG